MDSLLDNRDKLNVSVIDQCIWDKWDQWGYKVSVGYDSIRDIKYTPGFLIKIRISDYDLYKEILEELKQNTEIKVCDNAGDGLAICGWSLDEKYLDQFAAAATERSRIQNIYSECISKLRQIGVTGKFPELPDNDFVDKKWYKYTFEPKKDLYINVACKSTTLFYKRISPLIQEIPNHLQHYYETYIIPK